MEHFSLDCPQAKLHPIIWQNQEVDCWHFAVPLQCHVSSRTAHEEVTKPEMWIMSAQHILVYAAARTWQKTPQASISSIFECFANV